MRTTLAQSTAIDNSALPSIDLGFIFRLITLGLMILMIITVTGCSTAQPHPQTSTLHTINHTGSCESDVHNNSIDGDNTIIIQDNQIAGYCYIGWDS